MLVFDSEEPTNSNAHGSSAVDYLVLKNSWGVSKNEFGMEIVDSGNYFITEQYLIDSIDSKPLGFMLPSSY